MRGSLHPAAAPRRRRSRQRGAGAGFGGSPAHSRTAPQACPAGTCPSAGSSGACSPATAGAPAPRPPQARQRPALLLPPCPAAAVRGCCAELRGCCAALCVLPAGRLKRSQFRACRPRNSPLARQPQHGRVRPALVMLSMRWLGYPLPHVHCRHRLPLSRNQRAVKRAGRRSVWRRLEMTAAPPTAGGASSSAGSSRSAGPRPATALCFFHQKNLPNDAVCNRQVAGHLERLPLVFTPARARQIVATIVSPPPPGPPPRVCLHCACSSPTSYQAPYRSQCASAKSPASFCESNVQE